MGTNNLNIRNFVNDPEASEQELLLKLFHFQGNESNTLNIEQVPALLKSVLAIQTLMASRTD